MARVYFCAEPYRDPSCGRSVLGRRRRASVHMGAGGTTAKSTAGKVKSASIEELTHAFEELSNDERARLTASSLSTSRKVNEIQSLESTKREILWSCERYIIVIVLLGFTRMFFVDTADNRASNAVLRHTGTWDMDRRHRLSLCSRSLRESLRQFS